MSFFAERWGIKKSGMSDGNIPPLNTMKDRPVRVADNVSDDKNLSPCAMETKYYSENGLSDKVFNEMDKKKANDINKKFEKLGIPRYAVCSPRGGLSFRAIRDSCVDKPNVGYVSQKDVSKYLEKNFGISLNDVEEKSVTTLVSAVKSHTPEKKGKKVENSTLPTIEPAPANTPDPVIPSIIEKEKSPETPGKKERKPRASKKVAAADPVDDKEADDLDKSLDKLTKLMESAIDTDSEKKK